MDVARFGTDKTNLFTTYVQRTDEEMVEWYGHADRDRITDERVALLQGYREVEGVYPPREVCPTNGI